MDKKFYHTKGAAPAKFYAVRTGTTPGVYATWDECKAQVDGFPKAAYKKFGTREEAMSFINDVQDDAGGQAGGKRAREEEGVEGGGEQGQKAGKAERKKYALDGDGDAGKGGYYLYFDGGSRGNGAESAVAGAGAVLYQGVTRVWQGGVYLKTGSTNNEAEYEGLILGLEEAAKLGVGSLVVRGDSKLVVNQVLPSRMECNKAHLRALRDRARELLKKFEKTQLLHILREGNKVADQMANRAMDKRKGFSENVDAKAEKESADDFEDDFV